MGGNAAKERRKLKRQQEAKSQDNQVPDEPKSKKTSKVAPTRDSKQVRPKKPFKSPHKAGNSKSFKKFESKGKLNQGPPKIKTFDLKASKEKIKKKVKKPKHLAKKMREATDPKVIAELQKQQDKLNKDKAARIENFKAKVIASCGGVEAFDNEAYETMMSKGGGKLQNIFKAVKVEKDYGEKIVLDIPDVDAEEEVNLERVENQSKLNPGERKEVEKKILDIKDNKEDDVVEKVVESNETELPNELSGHDPDGGEKGDSEEKEVEPNNSSKSSTKTSGTDNKSDSDSDSDSDGDGNGDGDGDSDSSSDSDSDEEAEIQNSRSRGRKRKGRQEADAKREVENKIKEMSKDSKSKKTSRSKDKRRCIGRKALTDYKVGTRVTGTVRYVKPTLGVFIDVGSHSDAFCHISRASDDFIEVITDDLYKVGDVLENKVRIVEIDRKKKRITASLQTDARLDDEKESARARRERTTERDRTKRIENWNPYSNKEDQHESNNNWSEEQEVAIEVEEPREEVPIIMDPNSMTPAELKRARKLQRRQERRKQQELTGIAA